MADPEMDHLPGFWDDANWDDAHWIEYNRRMVAKGPHAERRDQFLHRWMARILPMRLLKWRETRQWPSGTGSYDPCMDHMNYLFGARRFDEVEALSQAAQARRSGWILWP